MSLFHPRKLSFVFWFLLLGLAPWLLQGCASGPAALHGGSPFALEGKVTGGQQPVSGATLQLYAAGIGGDGSAATPLLTSSVLTDSGGNFSITGLYTCPSGGAQVYITATGGSPGLAAGIRNPGLSLMTALGSCGNLSPTTNVAINEVTTAAATSALAPFASSYTSIGSSSSDLSALQSAFAVAAIYANTATGIAPGNNVPSGYTVPVPQINTVADIIAACVNSAGGVAGDGSVCGQLFSLTRPPAATLSPSNTIDALLNVAKNPSLNTAALFNLISPNPPFQPSQSVAPPDLGIALLASGSVLTFSPSSLSFPVTTAGFPTNPLTTTLSNTGGSPASLGAVTFGGANASDFSQINDCPAMLAAGASCVIQVTAMPAAQGARSGSLLISSSSIAAGSVSAALSDGGTSANAGPVTLSPAKLSFNTSGSFQDITLTNAGNTPLSFKSVTTSNAAFTVSNNTCSTLLPAQSSCTLTVQANGALSNGGVDSTYSGMLTITDDAVAGPQTVSLFSSGKLTVQVPVFPNTAVGSMSAAVQSSVVGTSHGDQADFVGTITGANAGDFSPSPAGCVNPGAPPAWQLCYYSMRFSPSGPGVRTARFYHGSLTTGEYAVLTGFATGSGSLFTATTPTLTGYVSTVSTPPLSGTITIQNVGSTTLSFPTLPIYGADPRGFTTSGNCTSVAPGTSCTFTVRYSVPNPQAGTVSATLYLTDAASGVSFHVPLNAIYNLPPAVITPGTYTFPSQAIGTSATQNFTVADPQGNPLGQAVTITNPNSKAGSPFQFSPASCQASSTALCTFSVTYTASSTGSQNVSLQVNSTQFAVSGSGFYSGTPTLVATPSPLTFPDQALDTPSSPGIVTLTNTGPDNSSINLQSINLGGSTPSSFRLLSTACGSTLAHGASCQVMLAFAPTVIGPQSAVLTVVSSAGSSPTNVTLTGNGY